ncbi:hypothetical protein T484DRAFT_1877630, partial [Baffinella frigidus]
MDSLEEPGGADRPKIESREEAERVLGGLARAERSQGYAKTSWEEAMRLEAISFLRAERERKSAIAEAAERRWLRSSTRGMRGALQDKRGITGSSAWGASVADDTSSLFSETTSTNGRPSPDLPEDDEEAFRCLTSSAGFYAQAAAEEEEARYGGDEGELLRRISQVAQGINAANLSASPLDGILQAITPLPLFARQAHAAGGGEEEEGWGEDDALARARMLLRAMGM